MYQIDQTPEWERIIRLSDGACIPINDANRDYIQFKQDIADGETLLNVDGSTMTHDEAMAWVDAHPGSIVVNVQMTI